MVLNDARRNCEGHIMDVDKTVFIVPGFRAWEQGDILNGLSTQLCM